MSKVEAKTSAQYASAKSSAPKGISVGLNRGHSVTRRVVKNNKHQGTLGERVKLIRSVVREVTGYAPYERRMMEILKGGGNNPTKRAMRFAKRRLGTHLRAKRKVSEMGEVIANAKKADAAAKAAAKQK